MILVAQHRDLGHIGKKAEGPNDANDPAYYVFAALSLGGAALVARSQTRVGGGPLRF